MNQELKPCPFCGSLSLKMVQNLADRLNELEFNKKL